MANEATISAGLSITKSSGGLPLIKYRAQPTSFKADVSGAKGPTPGSIAVSTDGTDVDLTELETPGLCRIMNQDATNYVDVGRYDPETDRFYPLMRLLPTESYVLRLSPLVEEEFTGTGTGTLATSSTLRIKANTAACVVLVEAFEA